MNAYIVGGIIILGGLVVYLIILEVNLLSNQRVERNLNNIIVSLRSIMESTGSGLLVLNSTGETIYFNQKFLMMWGIPSSILKDGDSLIDVIIEKSLMKKEHITRKINELNVHVEIERFDEITLKDGRVFEFSSNWQYVNQKAVGQVWSFLDITLHKEHEKQLKLLVTRDALTNLPNDILIKERLEWVISLTNQYEKKILIGCFYLTINEFNNLYDSYGQTIVDELITEIVQRLMEYMPRNDTLARVDKDKDQFVIIMMTDVPQERSIVFLIKKYIDVLSMPFNIGGHAIQITCSIGISCYPQNGKSAEELLQNAQSTMYSARAQGNGNNFLFCSDNTPSNITKLFSLETDLQGALERNELSLEYQPIINLQTGYISGVEALIRWTHSEYGLISPLEFIPLAEKTNLINTIGEWVLRTACIQHSRWRNSGLPPISISVNFSSEQFKLKELVQTISDILKETQIEPASLEIEMPENRFLDINSKNVVKPLEALAKLGVRFAVDDFGINNSDFSYIKNFTVDTVKIDQSFISGIDSNPDNIDIVLAMINIAKALRLRVVAEGITTKSQLKFLILNECDEGQGYYFSKPIDVDSFTNLLKENPKY